MRIWAKVADICRVALLSVFCITFLGCLGYASEVADVDSIEDSMPVKAEELDLGDYQSEMAIGEKQLLSVTVLPLGATEQTLNYISSNMSVATVNGMGRITALSAGSTQIVVSCGNVSNSFLLTVTETKNAEIAVTKLDLGECPKEITIGTSQLLTVYTIPADATNQVFTYQSDNKEVASVNELGRLTGNNVGTANITVICGKIKATFTVEVVPKEEIIAVTDIEISDYEKEIKVDSTLVLTATVLPLDATDAVVRYSSSDTNIATVNSSGEIKGIAPGTVVISVSAGAVIKQVTLTVIIGTTGIKLNRDYLVLKPEDTYQLKATVQPTGAKVGVTYKSMDSDIASVSAGGLVTAKKCGNTAVVVSNGDLQVSVIVIVNREGKAEKNKYSVSNNSSDGSTDYPDNIDAADYPIISSEMLKYFYETGKSLTIHGKGYTLYVDGRKIVNYENELHTLLNFEHTQEGISFSLNEGKKLCGVLVLDTSEQLQNEKYLYLYHEGKKKYQKLETEDINLLELSTAGTYLLAPKNLFGFTVNVIVMVIGIIMVLIGISLFVFTKKKYWFW